MKVGFTGTRDGMSDHQRVALMRLLAGATELHHGDCIGADGEADAMARAMGIRVVIHPPIDDSQRAFCVQEGDEVMKPATYLVRNRAIVDATDVLVATPRTNVEERRSGTWATIRYARQVGKPVRVIQR